jgi:hypothetical protein
VQFAFGAIELADELGRRTELGAGRATGEGPTGGDAPGSRTVVHVAAPELERSGSCGEQRGADGLQPLFGRGGDILRLGNGLDDAHDAPSSRPTVFDVAG